MADTIDNTAPRSTDAASLPANPTTPPPHRWDDANAQNQTPVVKKIAGQDRFSIDDKTRDMKTQYARVAEETKGHYLVGMSPDDFMKTFLPWNVDTPADYQEKLDDIPPERREDLRKMASQKLETGMYKAFTDALQGWPIETKEEANGANIIVTKFGKFRKPDPECRNLAVDMGHYTEDNLPPNDATSHRLMETNVEFKLSTGADPFVDPKRPAAATKSTGNSDRVRNAEENIVDNTDGAANDLSLGQSASGISSTDIPTDIAMSEPAVLIPAQKDWPGESKSGPGKHTRGQIAAYASITMFLSYRKHFMSVVVFGRFARLIFWDRRGAIVSSRFDYTRDDGDKILFEFYLRFSQLTAEQRGYDPTVVEVPQDDPDAQAALAQFKEYDREMWNCNAQMMPRVPIEGATPPEDRLLRMTVKFGDSAERSFIIPAPIFEDTCISPFSRSTRRALAYACSVDPTPGKEREKSKKSKDVVFMKDYWREESARTRPEAEIYSILAEKKVPHVATMIVGGDVEGMRTKTQEACFKESAYPLVDREYFRLQTPLQCHRLFLDTVARDLSAFGNCRVLVNCIADAMEAAQCAFDLARILHRDISSGNIMITPTHRGLLIDWDLCLVLDSQAVTHRTGRTGTWQFMSINLLRGGANKESIVHTLDDDRESAFWVLVYTALRYLKHDLSPIGLYNTLLSLFDDTYDLDIFDHPIGGAQKNQTLPNIALDSGRDLAKFDVPGFNALLTELAGLLVVRYRQPSAEAIQEYEIRSALLAQVGLVDKRDPVAIYKAKLERQADPKWLYETLRHHANLIPLPTQPSAAPSSGDSAKRKGPSPATVYDFYHNELHSLTVANGSERLKRLASFHLSRRLVGLGARSFQSQRAEDMAAEPAPEPEAKRIKLDEEDEKEL